MAKDALITDRAPEFRAALADGGALMALDVGTRTIGTAFCDAGWRFATPGSTLTRGKFAAEQNAGTECEIPGHIPLSVGR